ncbi:uncharacterized protein [Aquarana catesbeiana]|uniref:uncharacterized protein n=1 Tax=Aquarana catesbeiana TaxID=8400 RepID=UPI003CC9CEA1
MMPCLHTSPNSRTPMLCIEYIHGWKNGYTQHTDNGKKPQESPLKNTPMNQDKNNEALILSLNLENDPGNLVLVADFVKKNRDEKIRPPNSEVMKDMYIRICGLDGTIYSGEQYTLESWEELYLPEPTKMEVFGVLESSEGMAPVPQWVVLVGEDGHVYGYEDEKMYLFANSLQKLLKDGIKTDTYYDYPDDISDEEEEVLQKDEEIQKIRQKTDEFIDSKADSFNRFMNLYFKV